MPASALQGRRRPEAGPHSGEDVRWPVAERACERSVVHRGPAPSIISPLDVTAGRIPCRSVPPTAVPIVPPTAVWRPSRRPGRIAVESLPRGVQLPIVAVDAFPVSYPEPNDHNRQPLRSASCASPTPTAATAGASARRTGPRPPSPRRSSSRPCATTSSGATPCATQTIMRDLHGADLVVRHGRRRHRRLRALRASTWRSGISRARCSARACSTCSAARRTDALPAIASSHAVGSEVSADGARRSASWLDDRPDRRQGRLRQARQRQPRLRPRPRRRLHEGGPRGDRPGQADHDRLRRAQPVDGARGRGGACAAFEEYDLDWIEEPLGADDPAGLRAAAPRHRSR